MRVRGRGPGSGIPVDYSFVPVITFRAGKIVRMERYDDREAAVAAMGGGLTGAGAGWLIPHLSRTILARTPASARGRAVGFFFFAIYLGDLINPIVIRPIALQLGLHRTFFIIGGIVAVSALQIVLPSPESAMP